MLDKLTIEDFQGLLKQPFEIYYTPSDAIKTTLVSATALPSFKDEDDDTEEGEPQTRKSFSLIFRSESTTEYLPQRIYTVKNDQLGTMEIFIVPIGPDKHGMRYQAIFS